MPASRRRDLLRHALSALIALDAVALVALVLNQWLIDSPALSWLLAAALAAPLFALSRPLSSAVLDMADRHAGIPETGVTIPGSGQ